MFWCHKSYQPEAEYLRGDYRLKSNIALALGLGCSISHYKKLADGLAQQVLGLALEHTGGWSGAQTWGSWLLCRPWSRVKWVAVMNCAFLENHLIPDAVLWAHSHWQSLSLFLALANEGVIRTKGQKIVPMAMGKCTNAVQAGTSLVHLIFSWHFKNILAVQQFSVNFFPEN